MYPYRAGGTTLVSTLPPWASAGGKLFAHLRDPEMRATIKGELLVPSETVIERSGAQMKEFARHVSDIGQLEFDALVRLMDRKDPSFRE